MTVLYRWLVVLILGITSTPAFAAIALVGNNVADGGANTQGSASIARPAGSTTDTFMVVQVAVRVTGTTITPPAGWTLLRRDTEGTTLSTALYYKFNAASDTSPFTFTFGTATRYAIGIVAYDGVDPDNPFDAHAANTNTSSATLTAPSITETYHNERVIWFYSHARSGNINTPASAGTTLYRDVTTNGTATNNVAIMVTEEAQTTAAATGAQNATHGTAAINVAQTVGLRPLVQLRAEYVMEQNSWNGTSGEVLDTSGFGFNGTSVAGATTAVTTPAISGNPGTCRYGVFSGGATAGRVNMGGAQLGIGGGAGVTVMAWARWSITPSTGNNWGALVTNQSAAAADTGQIWLEQSQTNANWEFAVSTSTSRQYVFSSAVPAANTWTHVAGVYDGAQIRIYVNGVLSGTQAHTGTITADNAAYLLNVGSWAFNSSNFRSFQGSLDEARIYDGALIASEISTLMNVTRPCSQVDHYAINGSTTVVNCDVATVQFTAHNSGHTVVSPPIGTLMTVSTTTGTGVWQPTLVTGGGTWTPSGTNNGNATYLWPGGQSTFSVNLRHNAVATVGINVIDGNSKAEAAAEDLAISFVNSGFRVTANGTSVATVGTQLSAKNSNTGFGTQTLYLQAIRTDTNTGSCVGLFQSQTVTIEMAAARMNPTGSTSQVSVMNSSSAMVALGTGGGAAGTYTSVSLAFDAQSKAPLVINYPNAGSVSLFARYQLPAPPTGVYASGSSNTFVVRPFGFRISGPPNGRTGTGSLWYAKAGATWPNTVTVTAVAWEAGDDTTPLDGIPDSDAILAGNATTTNFGAETSPATATLSHTLAEPAAGNSGTLTAPLSTFTSGAATASATFSEVGIINLFASSTNYLGSGQAVTNSATGYAGVGRFSPDHFFITSSSLTNRSALACATSPFTYMGENFGIGLTLEARNTSGVVTQNYTTANGFAKLVPSTVAQLGLGARSGTTNLTPVRLVPASSTGTFAAGVAASITATATVNRITPALTPDGPFATTSVGVAPADSDGVTLLPANMNVDVDNNAAVDHQRVGATTDFRFGRLRLQSANGSERLPLTLRVETQYWNGNGYVINNDDNCTPLAANNVAFGNYRGNLVSGDTTVSAITAISGGVRALQLTAPVARHTGSVDVSINLTSLTAGASCLTGMAASTGGSKPWLQGAWCGTASDDDPSARATFGIYGASDRVIYLRENY